MIHPTAIVHPKAVLDPTVEVGPFAIIDEHVQVGPRTNIGAHAWLTGWLELGPENQVGYGAVLGADPQDTHFSGARSYLRIGKGNRFREYCTVHRGTKEESATVLGDENFLMAHSHLAHNCHLGSRIIIANGALLAGYVEVEDRAFISGNCVVHQFVRLGQLCLLSGGTRVSKDVPPFMTIYGTNEINSINLVGLRRAGLSAESRKGIRQAYRILFRSGLNTSQALAELKKLDHDPALECLVRFIENSKRGICWASLVDVTETDEE